MNSSITMKQLFTLLIAGLFLGQLSGCSGDTSAQNGSQKTGEFRQDTAEVSIETVSSRSFNRSLRTTGTLEPKQQAVLNTLVGGQIAEIYVDISDQVQQGDPLLKIRQVDYQEALEQAKANLSSARVQLEDAQREMERTRNLVEAGSGTQQALDQAQTKYNQAQAAVQQAQAAFNVAQQDMEDTIIRAPYDGVITQRNFEPKEFAAPGEPAFEIQDLSVLDAELEIPESYLGAVTPEAQVEISFKGQFSSKPAEIVAINPKVNRDTRTFTVKVRVDNKNLVLPSGVFAVARFDLQEVQDVPAVPREAVQKNQGRTFVWLVKDNKAYQQEITEGASNENWVMVEQGLTAGDQVAVEGVGVLIDGYPVKASTSPSS